MGFIQIIEIETTRPDEVEALVSEWRAKTARDADRAAWNLHQRQRSTKHVPSNRRVPILRGGHGQLRTRGDGLTLGEDARAVRRANALPQSRRAKLRGVVMGDSRDFPHENGCPLTGFANFEDEVPAGT
jgi:hypothetical protein